jgi:general secretion pathway protein A
MYESHWGLRETPFRACLDPGLFYESPTHEEALARLHFLVDERRRLGLLLGAAGSGKSLLFEVFAGQLRRSGSAVAKMSLLGLSPAEMLWQSIADLGGGAERGESIGPLWQTLTDRVTELRYERRDTVFLLDDADRAGPDVLAQLTRLAKFDRLPEARLTVVLAGRRDAARNLGPDLLEMVELRIDVECWEQTDTENYVKQSLARAGARAPVFADQALARLQQLTDGVPRRVSQLADLALLAGAGQAVDQIDADLVESVYQELALVEA